MISPISVTTTKIESFYKKTKVSDGTGFFWQNNGKMRLVTNWHNFSGRHLETKETLSKTAALPDRIKFNCYIDNALDPEFFEANLYEDSDQSDAPERPKWYEHPLLGSNIDVVSLDIELPRNCMTLAVNKLEITADMLVQVSDDVFIVGYPLGLTDSHLLPIWKRGSVASEYDVAKSSSNNFLVDAASREGMSGSPVFSYSKGSYTGVDGSLNFGLNGLLFLGIYSGRIASRSENDAQLGFVWHNHLVERVAKTKNRGKSSFLP